MTSSPGMLPVQTASAAGSPRESFLNRVLALDIGSSRTKAAVFERRDGHWRLLGAAEAFSTPRSPREGVLGGAFTVLRELERAAAIRLIDPEGAFLMRRSPTQDGVDALVASASAADPLRLGILATTAELSGAAARRAIHWSYVDAVDCAAMDTGDPAGARWADADHPRGRDDVLARLHEGELDVVLMAGGTEGGARSPVLDIARLVAAARAPGHAAPTVVFAGNATAADEVAHILAGRADVRFVENLLPRPGAPSPRPSGEMLDDLYSQRKLGALFGVHELNRAANVPLISSARGLALAWGLLAQELGGPVLGLDVGGRHSIVGLAQAGRPTQVYVQQGLGVSQGLGGLMDQVGLAAVSRWLPFDSAKGEIQQRATERLERAFAVLQDHDDLLFQEALVREAVRLVLRQAVAQGYLSRPEDTAHIVASGALRHAASSWHAILAMLDAAQPQGVARLWLDRSGVLPAAGALAALDRQAAQSIVGQAALQDLGSAVCFVGKRKVGADGAKGEWLAPGGAQRKLMAAWGSIHPTDTDRDSAAGPVQLSLRPASGVQLPGHEGKRTVNLDVQSGPRGVILDCRGRPVDPEHNGGQAQARVRSWLLAGGSEEV